jgi:hypothetical protein
VKEKKMPPKKPVTTTTTVKPEKKKKKKNVLQKERTENEFWFHKQRKCFMLGPSTVLRGVHHALHSSIVTRASSEDLKHLPIAKEAVCHSTVSLTETEVEKKLKKHYAKRGGVKRGKMVHSHVEKICKRALAGKENKKNPVHIHPQAELFFRLLDKHNYKKEHGELGVFWKDASVGTQIDATAIDNATGSRVLCELKTGELSTKPKWRLRFKPYTIVSDRGLACLQLLCSSILHRHTFPTVPIKDHALFHISSNATGKSYHVPDELVQLQPLLQTALLKTRANH